MVDTVSSAQRVQLVDPATNLPYAASSGGSGPTAAQLPASLGPKVGASSLSVVPNTDTAFPVTDAGGSFTVDTGTPGTFSISGLAATGAAVSGNPVLVAGSDGTNARTIGTNSAGSVYVNGAGANGAAFNAQPVVVAGYDGANLRSLNVNTSGSLKMVGDVASGTTDAASPVKIGGYASSSVPTAVTTGQRTNGWYGLNGQIVVAGVLTAGSDGYTNNLSTLTTSSDGTGRLTAVGSFAFNGTTWDRQRGDTNGTVNQPYALASSRWGYAAAAGGISNTTTAVTIIAAAGAGVRNYVTGIQIDAGTLGAATEIAIRDGAGGAVLWRGFITTGGAMRQVEFGVPLKGTANTLMEVVTLTASVTGSVYFNAQGFQGS